MIAINQQVNAGANLDSRVNNATFAQMEVLLGTTRAQDLKLV